MLALAEVEKWLLERLNKRFIVAAWIFGSIVRGARRCNDVDLFLQCEETDINSVLPLRRALEQDFMRDFNLPLQCMILTSEESNEFRDFLKGALVGARQIYKRL
jgi:predicted nucleotidyltransferase